MSKELFIIRHGETDLNLQGIVQGRGVNPSLNETGRRQAALFFGKYQDEKFELVCTSTLKRAHESVSSFIQKGIPWLQFPELDEISWGIFEGQRATHEFKELYRNLLSQWNQGHLDAKALKGESPVEVSERQRRFMEQLVLRPEKKILICMHGRAMRIFLPTLLNEDLRQMENYPHHNLTLYKLIFDGSKFSIELFNDLSHLNPDGKN